MLPWFTENMELKQNYKLEQKLQSEHVNASITIRSENHPPLWILYSFVVEVGSYAMHSFYAVEELFFSGGAI